MNAPSPAALHGLPLRPLTARLILALAIGSTAAPAFGAPRTLNASFGTIDRRQVANPRPWLPDSLRGSGVARPTATVTNCDDDGTGSLRATVAAAASGDTIDFTGLSCSTISLTTGFINVTQDDLALTGPGAGALSIDGGLATGILRHSGLGTLSVSGLTLTNGHYESAATPFGGCLYSAANLTVTDSTLSYCAVVGTSNVIALGGGVYSKGDLSLVGSTVTQSHAQGTATGAHGGGVYVAGNFTAQGSLISYNQAYGVPINGGQGGGVMTVGTTLIQGTTIFYNGSYDVGGLWTQGEVTVDSSTIAYNSASHAAGMRATYSSGSPTATIINSTIAANHSFATVGGLNLIIPATISNSTIAFNEAFNDLAGILMSGPTLDLESTIIANNTSAGTPDDFQVYGSLVITGANNLVVASSVPLPPGTLQSDPLLGLLGDNGGQTPTIPLLAGSPAIDAGNNVANLPDDQRGVGFARVVGPFADIGAFEVQTSDVIFRDGFELP
jgi:hypothetical protein